MKLKVQPSTKKTLKLKKVPKSGESTLNKAVKNVTEILKKKVVVDKVEVKSDEKLPKEKNIIKIKSLKKSKAEKPAATPTSKVKNERGIVYIGHIPHGFFEEQMKGYFKQFGKVTNVRLSRSKNTGRSKGYGFVEFLHPEVAKIAAESMNNYLMCGRLVKTEYIPPEKQHGGYFKGREWSKKSHPKKEHRKKSINVTNSSMPNKNHELTVKKSVKRLSKLSQKLKAAGIDLNMKLGDVEI